MTASKSSASVFVLMRRSEMKDVFLFVLGLIFHVTSGALVPFNSVIFKGISDALMTAETNFTRNSLDNDVLTSEILFYCAMYLALGFALFILGYLANGFLYTWCERRLHFIRKAYLKAVLRQNVAFFDQNDAGSLIQKMSSGVEKIKDGVGDKLGLLLSASGTFISGLIVGFVLCWQMTLVMMITAPLMLISMYVSGRLLSRAARSEMEATSSASSIAMEVLSGIRTVMAFNAQSQEVSRYGAQLEKAKMLGIRKAYVLAGFAAVPLALMFASMAIAFWFGTTLVIDGTITSGTVFGVFWAVLIGTLRLGQAAPQLGVILGAKLAIIDVFKIIDRIPPIDCERMDGLTPRSIVGDLEFSEIYFAYPSRPEVQVLKGISLNVRAGETVAFVGPSGCGKSTLLGFLQRFYDQDAGIITLDGIPLRDYNIGFLRGIIGVVQQEPVIFVSTIGENIRMGDDSMTEEEIVDVCRQANAHDFITKLPEGYETIIGEGHLQLSGGQKQRIALARILARRPKILLLDEATSALDSESEEIVTNALERAREGRTTISVAHRLSTVRNVDRIIVFDAGKIVEIGNHDELMEIQNGVYAKLVKLQEIQKAQEDTTLDDVDPQDIRRALGRHDTTAEEELRRSRVELERVSSRIRESMISTYSQQENWIVEAARREMIDEGAMEASLTDIFRYSKPEMPIAAGALALTVLRGLTWPIFSVIYGQLFLILSAADEEVRSEVVMNSLLFFALAIYTGITTFSSGSLFGMAGEKMACRLRLDVYKNLLRQDASFFDDMKHNVGNLTSRLATDAPNVQAAIDQRLAESLQGLSSLTAGIILAFYFGWNMAPIGLITALLLVAAQSSVAQYLKFRGQKDLESAVEASRLVTESVLNVKCLQSLNKQQYILSAYSAASDEPHRRAVVRGLWQAVNFGLSNSFVVINFAIAYSFGLMLIVHGWTRPFTVFQVIEALNMASVSVMAAASYFPEYVRARISAGVLFSMMRTEPRFDSTSHKGEAPKISGNISLRNIYFSYPARPRNLVLDGISIDAKFGQTVALVGASGSGKSTVIQLLERFYDPLCGSVHYDQWDLRDLSIRHIRDHIALVGQEPTLFDLTIRENIAYGMPSCSQGAIEQAAKLANINNFIVGLPDGYDTRVGPRGGRLSGGQKQRIAIARAMVRNPKILLLDEATSALDADSQKVVQEALDKARLGRTCIVVAHRLSTIQNSDLIVVFREGRVVEQGTHSTLLARRGFYYKLVEKQQH